MELRQVGLFRAIVAATAVPDKEKSAFRRHLVLVFAAAAIWASD
jgi:hypothetical protein